MTEDNSLVFKTDGEEVFRIEDPYWSGTRTPETQLHITENKVLTHEEMLEIAAEREALNALDNLYQNNDNGLKELAEIESMDPVRTAIDGIGKYSDALKELRKIEHEELMEELQSKKKENFRLVAKQCMQEYEKTYNHDTFPVDESWVYMVGEYFGTGEGQTVCIMMTQANAGHAEDFETSNNKYVPCTTKEYRAVREFHEKFGTWMLHGLKFLSREDFFGDYAFYIPPMMIKLNNEHCYKSFYTYLHYNFA